MKTKRMGRTGLKVSEVCLGTMTFGVQVDQAESFKIMDRAYEAGIDFLDTSDVYPLGGGPSLAGTTESYVGAWLEARGLRNRIVLATKCRGQVGPGPNDVGLSRKHIMDAVEGSLRRLRTDYIDLYQTHQPDYATPEDETLRALDDLVRSGKVRYLGCSNYPAYRLARSLAISDKLGLARYDCLQPRYNILYREIESELLPLCADEGVGVIPYNPLAGGFLTGKYAKGQDVVEGTRFAIPNAGRNYQARYWHEAQFDAVQALKQITDAHGLSLTEVALAWVLHNPTITSAIVGASSAAQLDGSLPGVDLTLSDEVLAACDEAWYNLPRQRDVVRGR